MSRGVYVFVEEVDQVDEEVAYSVLVAVCREKGCVD